MSINVFIYGLFREYQVAVKEMLGDRCQVYITDDYFRPWDEKCIIKKADLSIIIADHSPHDRYGSEANWLQRVAKNIYSNSNKVMGIMCATEEEWKGYQNILGENTKIYCVNWTIDDDYNIQMIKDKLTDYFI